jgi:hypothetical protein
MPSLSIIKDGAIILAIILLGWWVYHSGENAVHVQDIKGLQQQIVKMNATTASWQKTAEAANATEQNDLQKINAGASVVRPITVRLCPSKPASQGMLPGTTTAPGGAPPQAWGSDVQAQRDIGPAVQEYEHWLETEFAECRAVVAQWPTK